MCLKFLLPLLSPFACITQHLPICFTGFLSKPPPLHLCNTFSFNCFVCVSGSLLAPKQNKMALAIMQNLRHQKISQNNGWHHGGLTLGPHQHPWLSWLSGRIHNLNLIEVQSDALINDLSDIYSLNWFVTVVHHYLRSSTMFIAVAESRDIHLVQ